MPKRFLLAVLLSVICRAQYAVGQTPSFKLLYAPSNLGAPGGNPFTMVEGDPGILYVLCGMQKGTLYGESIFAVTGAGASKLAYEFPAFNIALNLVQNTNGQLYGSGSIQTDPQQAEAFYYSLDRSGQNFREYRIPGTPPMG
jgi:hypothetical protein